MTDKKEVADKANASNTEEESSTDEDNLEESKSTVEEESAGADYLEEDKPEIDYKKRYGDSTREYQTLKQEKEKLSGALDEFEKLSQRNPRIIAEIEAAQGMTGSSNTNTDTVKQQIEEAIEPLRKVTQGVQDKERLTQVRILTDFEKKNPDLFSPKATKEEKKEIRQKIGKVANTLFDTGMSYENAVSRAHLMVNPKAAESKGRDQAHLDSLDEKQAGFSSQTSTEGAKPTEGKYNSEELRIAKMMDVGDSMKKKERK